MMNGISLKSQSGNSIFSVMLILAIGSAGAIGANLKTQSLQNISQQAQLGKAHIVANQRNLSAITIFKSQIKAGESIPNKGASVDVAVVDSNIVNSKKLDELFMDQNDPLSKAEINVKVLDSTSTHIIVEASHMVKKRNIRTKAYIAKNEILDHERLCDSGQTILQEIVFEPIRNCPYNAEGNSSPATHKFQARFEQQQDISLPDGGTFCSFSFQSKETNFKYDDAVSLVVNDRLMMGTHGIENYLQKDENSLPIWDWEKVVDQKWDGPYALTYCHGDCQLARSDRRMPVELKLTTSQGALLQEEIESKGKIDFKVVISGDNESDDCQHSGLTLQTLVKYY